MIPKAVDFLDKITASLNFLKKFKRGGAYIMQGRNSKGNSAFWARKSMALWPTVVLVVAFSARPTEAALFADVANYDSNTVSVIDTATHNVVATTRVATHPFGVGIIP